MELETNPKKRGGGRVKKTTSQDNETALALEQLATSVGNLAIEEPVPMTFTPGTSLQIVEEHFLKCSRQIQSLSSEMAKLKKALYQLKLEQREEKDHSNESGCLDLSNELATFVGGNMKTSDEVKQALQKYVVDHNLVPVDANNTVTSFKPDSELKKLLGVKRSTKPLSVDDVHREVLKIHIKKQQEMSSSP